MTHEISISMLLKVLKSAWWKILIFTVVVALIAAAFTAFLVPKKYSSSVTFFIINTSSTYEYTSTSLLDAATQLSNDYVEIIKSDDVLDTIVEDLKAEGYVNVTPAKIRAMISSQTSKDVSTFTVTVTSDNNELSHSVAKAIEKHAPQKVKDITRPKYESNLCYYVDLDGNGVPSGLDEFTPLDKDDLECISVIRSPKLATTPISPNLIQNTTIAAVVAVVVSYAFFLILKLFDTVIRGEESAKALVDLPIIGKIPTWETSSKSTSGNNKAKEN
ncbi:MAG: hypothetical protein E7653_04035 [Ruminococcaceae bacterium]|nr:hypothetical protein [Oscillospiraceae bacterium]